MSAMATWVLQVRKPGRCWRDLARAENPDDGGAGIRHLYHAEQAAQAAAIAAGRRELRLIEVERGERA